MHKTTLYLDDDTYVRLQRLAEERGETQASVVREALAQYTAASARQRPKSIGLGKGGKKLSARSEKLLEGFGAEKK